MKETASHNKLTLFIGIVLLLCCLVFAGGLLFYFWFSLADKSTHPPLVFPTRNANITDVPLSPEAELPTPFPLNSPQGKIAYVCQIFKLQAQDQICIINANGTGQRRLTTDDKARHFYPSISPDGNSIFFSSNLDGKFGLYELSLTGSLNRIGNVVGVAPELSPDKKKIVFSNSNGQQEMIWIMDRDGSNLSLLYTKAWDPTWSPDGNQVLFATYINNLPQLAIINLDGSNFHPITDLPFIRGRSDWSTDGLHIATYSGETWKREIYLMNQDGSDLHQISISGGNGQGPSFSPDGQWVAFTAYYNSIGNHNGCEIYIMQIDGTRLTRLTNNDYCDWQPRWGP